MALTREQSIELGAVIEQRREALLAEIGEDTEQPALGRELDELRAVEAARHRYAEGSYGVCVECGTEIDYERLRAQPAAIRCIQCQRRHEQEHGPRAAPTL